MLTINDLTFAYGPKSPDVFSNLNLTLEPNHVYGLLGRNGAGKSTLLHLMAGLLRPVQGEVLYDGVPMGSRSLEVLDNMFLLPDEFSLPGITMERFVRYYSPFYQRFDHEVLAQCMADFSLVKDMRLDMLSLGERKKAYICFALATRTPLLLMDEPTNGLDIPSKSIFRKVLARHIGDNQTVVISTHQVHDVSTLFDELLVLQNDGQLVRRQLDDMAATTENIEEMFVELTKDGKETER